MYSHHLKEKKTMFKRISKLSTGRKLDNFGSGFGIDIVVIFYVYFLISTVVENLTMKEVMRMRA